MCDACVVEMEKENCKKKKIIVVEKCLKTNDCGAFSFISCQFRNCLMIIDFNFKF